MRLATGVFKSIETRYRLFLSESILGSTYVMSSIPLKVSSSIPNPRQAYGWSCRVSGECVSPCALEVFLLGFLLPSLSWLEVLQNEGVGLGAPLGHGAQELTGETWMNTVWTNNINSRGSTGPKAQRIGLNLWCHNILFIYVFFYSLGHECT